MAKRRGRRGRSAQGSKHQRARAEGGVQSSSSTDDPKSGGDVADPVEAAGVGQVRAQPTGDADQAEGQLRPLRRPLTLANIFGASFWVFGVLSVIAGAICYHVLGQAVFLDSLQGDFDLLLYLIPRFTAAMLIAAFVGILLPRDRVARYVSDRAGIRALLIGTAAGALTPGGPMTSFPLVRALRDAGTGRGPLIAYITSWSSLGFQRIINWELPLLGPELTIMRIISVLPLPIIAGLTSRWWPQTRASQEDGDVR